MGNLLLETLNLRQQTLLKLLPFFFCRLLGLSESALLHLLHNEGVVLLTVVESLLQLVNCAPLLFDHARVLELHEDDLLNALTFDPSDGLLKVRLCVLVEQVRVVLQKHLFQKVLAPTFLNHLKHDERVSLDYCCRLEDLDWGQRSQEPSVDRQLLVPVALGLQVGEPLLVRKDKVLGLDLDLQNALVQQLPYAFVDPDQLVEQTHSDLAALLLLQSNRGLLHFLGYSLHPVVLQLS